MTAFLQIQLSGGRIFKLNGNAASLALLVFKPWGLLNLLQYRGENFTKRKQKSGNNCREEENNSLMRKSEQINKLLFFFSQFEDERYQNFKNYQCTSILGGISKEKEVSSVCFYQSCNFEKLLSVSVTSRPSSHVCMLGFPSDTGQGQSAMQQF